MLRIITKILAIAIISMLCSSVVFAQKMRPTKQNLKKQRSFVSTKTTGKPVVNQKLSTKDVTIIYSEDFESTDYQELPDGWTRFTDYEDFYWHIFEIEDMEGVQPTPEDDEDFWYYQIWQVANDEFDICDEWQDGHGNIVEVEGWVPSHSGVQQLALSWFFTGGNAWAITPGFELVAGVEYSVSYWLAMPGYPKFEEVSGLKVTIGQEPTAEGMDEAFVLYEDFEMIYDPETLDHVLMSYTFTPETSGTYYLGFKDITNLMEGIYTIIDDIEISCDTNVGISKLSNDLSVYPNPARNIVYIDGKNIVKAEVYNMFGQLVDTQKGNLKSIDVSKYNTGVYMVKMYDVNNNIVITNITIAR